jgi:hypothetical protein
LGCFFSGKSYGVIFAKNVLGHILGHFSLTHPVTLVVAIDFALRGFQSDAQLSAMHIFNFT